MLSHDQVSIDGRAGDQGVMIGYACNETPELLPLETVLARRLNQFLYQRWPYDGKTQVTLRGGQITAIVASFQHAPKDELTEAVEEWLQQQTYVNTFFKDKQYDAPVLHVTQQGTGRLVALRLMLA